MVLGNSEFSCRCLTVIPALLLLSGTMLLAERVFDRQTMCCAAWMLIGSCGFIYWSRTACSFITLSAWVVWSVLLLRERENLFLRATLFFILFFSGSVWWGMHYLLTLPGVLLTVSGSLQKIRWQWYILPALLLALLAVTAVLVWCVSFPGVAWSEYPWRLWHQIRTSFVESWQIAVWPGSGGSLKMILNIPRMLCWWTLPVFTALVWQSWSWRELSSEQQRWLAGSLLLLLLTGIFPGRRWAYQLSILPFMLIIGGGWLSGLTGGEEWRQKVDLIMKMTLSLGCSFAASAILVFPLWDTFFGGSMPLWIMFGVPLLGLAGLGFMVFDTGGASSVEKVSGMNGPWSGYTLAGVCLSAALFAVVYSELGSYRTGKKFWLQCREYVRQLPAEEVIFYGKQPNSIAMYYMELPERRTVILNGEELTAALKNIATGEAVIIFEQYCYAELAGQLAVSGWEFGEPLAAEFGDVRNIHAVQSPEKFKVLYRITRSPEKKAE